MNGEQPDNDGAEKDLETLLEILHAGMDALKRSDKKDVLTQVEQRKQLAESLSLGGRLLRIYDEVKFVPDDRKDLLRRYRCVVSGREVQGADLTTIIRFNLRSKGYVLRFREPPVSYEEVNYEGYGPGGVALFIETLTDNAKRTVADVRHILDDHLLRRFSLAARQGNCRPDLERL